MDPFLAKIESANEIKPNEKFQPSVLAEMYTVNKRVCDIEEQFNKTFEIIKEKVEGITDPKQFNINTRNHLKF